jgi:hypothetical protein
VDVVQHRIAVDDLEDAPEGGRLHVRDEAAPLLIQDHLAGGWPGGGALDRHHHVLDPPAGDEERLVRHRLAAGALVLDGGERLGGRDRARKSNGSADFAPHGGRGGESGGGDDGNSPDKVHGRSPSRVDLDLDHFIR